MDSDKLERQVEELSARLANVQDKIKSQASDIENQASRTRWAVRLATLLIVIILGLISNPPKSEHVAKIVGENMFMALAEIDYESYYVFSVAGVNDMKKPLTLGIFGHVFMESDSFPSRE